MPSKVPGISGKVAVAAFERAGWVCIRIKGSHHILKKDGERHLLSIPVHTGETVGRGLLTSQIKLAKLTVEQFIDLLS